MQNLNEKENDTYPFKAGYISVGCKTTAVLEISRCFKQKMELYLDTS